MLNGTWYLFCLIFICMCCFDYACPFTLLVEYTSRSEVTCFFDSLPEKAEDSWSDLGDDYMLLASYLR